MIPSANCFLRLIRDEQIKDRVCKGAWGLLLLALLAWMWSYNNRQYSSGKTWLEDDPMLLSGFATVFMGILYSLLIDRNQVRLVRKLHDITVIDLDETRWLEIRVLLEKYARRCRIFIPVGVIILMILGYMIVGYFTLLSRAEEEREKFISLFSWASEGRIDGYAPLLFREAEERIDEYSSLILRILGEAVGREEFIAVSFFCAVLAGLRLGRFFANGLIGRAIRKVAPSFEMVIQHPDGAGGLDRIGRSYLLQAAGLLIPTIWFLIWIWIIPDMEQYNYRRWLLHFWILFLVLIFVIWPFAVIAPMYSFNRLIVTWKAKHLEPAIADVRAKYINWRGSHLQGKSQRRQIQELFNHLHSLTSLPDWPLSPRTLTIFFTTVVLPILAALVGSLLNILLK